MVVSLHEVTEATKGLYASPKGCGCVPPEAPLAMPDQELRHPVRERRARRRFHPGRSALRALTLAATLALTLYAAREMFWIVSLADVTALQWVLLGLFSSTFGWIALAAASASVGVLFGGGRMRSRGDEALETKTALLMPVYNEDPARTCASLHAMGSALERLGLAEAFEIFVISDTTDPFVWVRETAAMQALRASLSGRLPVWYRRREANVGKKAGNVREFVTRFGARYDFMVVLDADSLMSAPALATLVREMQADPSCGILQTLPRLHGARTFFGRLQQFASAIYGPIVARGVTAWQADDGNYWGHNAILRVAAFAASAGLPSLPGRKPFGGEILSHDFVEAALMRRAGFGVRMLPALEGSWEESPPTVLDVAARDRRWAQGNLQHLRILGARGLHWVSRAHMLVGVMSYAASPLWLALVVVGIALALQVASTEPSYFTNEPALFPDWPIFDSQRMVRLFALTMGVLMWPKLLGFARALLRSRVRRALGVVRITVGVVVETLFSAVYAPIFMLMQTQQLTEILRGKDAGWSVQRRESGATSWRLLLSRHAAHTLAGALVGAGLAYISTPMLIWISPTIAGLALAAPLSALSGSTSLARSLRWLGILSVPEESQVPPEVRLRDRFLPVLQAEIAAVDLDALLASDKLALHHFEWVARAPARPRGQPDLEHASASLKLADAESRNEALHWLTDRERLAVLSSPALFARLAELATE